jgi:hypothetical protein
MAEILKNKIDSLSDDSKYDSDKISLITHHFEMKLI